MPGKGRPFQRGQCANPGGRPKVLAEVRDLARRHTEEAIKALVAILRKRKAADAAKVAAACAILDRGYEAQVTNVFDQMSDDEQDALLETIETIRAKKAEDTTH
jgi:hypothetical protein